MRTLSLSKIFLTMFFIAAVGYGIFEARGQILGPQIKLEPVASPTREGFVTLGGKAAHIASLSMNGRPLTVTEDGSFSERYALAPGYNRIIFDAQDAYGRKAQRAVEIMYEAPDMPALPAQIASSTAPAPAASGAAASSTGEVAPGE